MWHLSLTSAVLCVLICLIPAQETKVENMKKPQLDEDRTENQASLKEYKYNRLIELSKTSQLIRLDDDSDFNLLFIQTPRNYSAIVLIVSSSGNCANCALARTNIRKLRDAYHSQASVKPTFFFVEVVQNDETKVPRRLGIRREVSEPVVIFIPEYGRLQDMVKLVQDGRSYDLKELARWIARVTRVYIRIPKEKLSLVEEYSFVITIVCCASFYLYKFRGVYMEHATNSTSVGLIIMSLILYCTSGSIYNVIKGSSFMGVTHENLYFVHPSGYDQLVTESLIVFVLYGLISYGVVLLTEFGKRPLHAFKYKYYFVLFVLLMICALPYMLVYGMFTRKLVN